MTNKQYLLEARPEVGKYWNSVLNADLSIDTITIGSHKDVWWICDQNHTWREKVKEFLKPKSVLCPYCDNRKALVGYNDLATTHPDLAKQWHPDNVLTPYEVTARSTKKVLWLGDCSHSWEVAIGRRVQKGEGCPYCAGRQVLVGFNDLATSHPSLVKEWHPDNDILPTEVSKGSMKKVRWICAANDEHVWESSINGRSSGNGCPHCSQHSSTAPARKLAETHPHIAEEWHPTKNNKSAGQVSLGSRYYAWWKCKEGHEWQARIPGRTRGSGCPVCTNKQVVAGVNDLATTDPELTKQWHPVKNESLTPEQVSRGSYRIVWWQCEKGHEWQAAVKNRVFLQQGCRRCNSSLQSSKAERELAKIVKELLPEERVETSVYGVISKELDIYVPSKKFAIEFNGVYWHSEAAGKDRYYHRDKQQACEAAGVFLYQVWEDDWKRNKSVVLRGLAHRLGATSKLQEMYPDIPAYYLERVGARKTRVRNVNYAQASEFLNEHHIQGSAKGSSYLALVDSQDRVRAVLVLKKSSSDGDGAYLIERYATAGIIPGGFTKLLKAAEEILTPSKWVTFADLELSNGGLYESNGFEVDDTLAPDYSYVVGGVRRHKFGYRLERFRKDPGLLHQEGLSERELALLNGIPRIWDSGKIKYVKCLDSTGSNS